MASVAKLKDMVDALVLCCAESGEFSVDDCAEGLESFFSKVEEGGLLKKALESPVVAAGEKAEILRDLCSAAEFPPLLANFLVTAAEFDKLRALLNRRRTVLEWIRSAGGTVRATVTVAAPVSPEDERRVREAVSRLAGGGKCEVEFVQDSEIIGGMIVRIGNSVYDDSVKTHLDGMRYELSK